MSTYQVQPIDCEYPLVEAFYRFMHMKSLRVNNEREMSLLLCPVKIHALVFCSQPFAFPIDQRQNGDKTMRECLEIRT